MVEMQPGERRSDSRGAQDDDMDSHKVVVFVRITRVPWQTSHGSVPDQTGSSAAIVMESGTLDHIMCACERERARPVGAMHSRADSHADGLAGMPPPQPEQTRKGRGRRRKNGITIEPMATTLPEDKWSPQINEKYVSTSDAVNTNKRAHKTQSEQQVHSFMKEVNLKRLKDKETNGHGIGGNPRKISLVDAFHKGKVETAEHKSLIFYKLCEDRVKLLRKAS